MVYTPSRYEEGSASTTQGLDLDRIRAMSEQDIALIVDDDLDTVALLKMTLQREGFNVVGAADGQQALERCAEANPDVILLDLMMPVMDGWETLNRLKTLTDAPTVIISVLDTDDAVVRAFTNGAVDYIRKPYSPKEVVARVQNAISRHGPAEEINMMVFPKTGLTIDLNTRQVAVEDKIIKLTPIEFSLLTALARKAPKPISYQSIAEEVWGEYTPKTLKRIKWVVHRLRKKLEPEPTSHRLIYNHTNYGYHLDK